jgi:CRP-like cAMP-binding protein
MANGKVAIIHKKTKTHITDILKDQYFGEIAFFSDLPRQATIKSRDFTEVLKVHREDFLQMALKVSEEAILLYHKIRQTINNGDKNYKSLQIKCYICYVNGHIAIDCK